MINKEGTWRYLFLSNLSLEAGLIAYFEYMDRVSCLRQMTSDQRIANFIDNLSKLTAENLGQEQKSKSWDSPNKLDNFEISSIQKTNKNNEPIYYLSVTSGAYGKWKFNKYDKDFQPSVPHGHNLDNKRMKLDSYRGYVFDKTIGFKKYNGRENKSFICGLWNNEDFRELATASLVKFIENNPRFNWLKIRGIKDPMILPKRRM